MGYIPEISRLRTPVTLVVILAISMGFLGFTYWTEYNRSLSFQRKIAFLQGTLTKVAKGENEAEDREEDFQRELRKQKEAGQRMNAMMHQEIIRLNQKYEHDQDQSMQTIKSKDAAIKEKEALISNLKRLYLELQQDMEGFQKNQSQLLEKFSMQSEKMEMLVRLKDKCYSQMNSIRKRISVAALPSEVAPAGGNPEPQEKDLKEEQPEVKVGAGTDKADRPFPLPAEPSTRPSAVRIPIPPLKLVDRLKNMFIDTGAKDQSEVKAETDKSQIKAPSPPAAKPSASPSITRALIQSLQPADNLKNVPSDSVKGSDTKSESPKNIASEVTVKRDDNAGPPPEDEDNELIDEEVNATVEHKQPFQPPKDEPNFLKPNEKEEAKKEKDPIDEKVKEAVEEKKPSQPLKDEPNLLKPNEKEEAKKEENPMDEEVKEAVEEKKPAQPLEDEADLVQPNQKNEEDEKEEPF